jgi:peptide deformylase
MFDIRTYGDPVLRKKAAEVDGFDEPWQRFIDELVETMYERDGVGLASPQVGKSCRIAVVDATGEDLFVLINPAVVYSSEEIDEDEEGCLSIPGITLPVRRPSVVSVEATGRDGKRYRIEHAGGLLARALQHEIDHLDGILFVDRISPLKRQLISGKLKKMAKEKR